MTDSVQQQRLIASGRNNPCPVCDRVKDSDCRMTEDRSMVLCHQNLGLTIKDGWDYLKPTSDGRCGMFVKIKHKQIRQKGVQVYKYNDRNNKPLAGVKRFDNGDGTKDFFQIRYDAKTKSWVNGLSGIDRSLIPVYRYTEIRKAIADGKPIFWVEGESCADALWSIGMAATTSIGGSGAYHRYGSYKSDLDGASEIIICPDRDQEGVKYARNVHSDFPHAKWLYPYPQSWEWKKLPKDKGLDIADWVTQDNASPADILASIENKPRDFASTEYTVQIDGNGFKSLINPIAKTQDLDKLENDFKSLMSKVASVQEVQQEAQKAFLMKLLGKASGVGDSLGKLWRQFHAEVKEFKPVDVLEFLGNTFNSRRWIISKFLPSGTVVILYAESGVGKSLFIYYMVKCITQRVPFLGARTRYGKVLIIQTDEPTIDTHERLSVGGFDNCPPNSVYVESEWHFSQIKQLKDWVLEHKPDLIIIDSLTSCNKGDLESEKDSSYGDVIYDLQKISNESGATFLLLHHENKQGIIRGTTTIKSNPSEIIRLLKDKEKCTTPTQRVVEVEKSRVGSFYKLLIELKPSDYSWQLIEDLGTDTVSSSSDQNLSVSIQAFLDDNNKERFTVSDLERALNHAYTPQTIRQECESLRRLGIITGESLLGQDLNGSKYRYWKYSSFDFAGMPIPQNQSSAADIATISTASLPAISIDINADNLEVEEF